jgi:2Fe-2S ferredoxin
LSLHETEQNGTEHEIEGKAGLSIMEVIRDSGIDKILALCGGCATCHVHIEPGAIDRLPPMSANKNDLLDGTSDGDEFSLMSCAIPFTDALAGARLRIAAQD